MSGYLLVELIQNPYDDSNQILLVGKYGYPFSRFDFTSFSTDADVYDFNGIILDIRKTLD